MAEGIQSPEESVKLPKLKQEGIRYRDGCIAVKISGEKGAKFDFYEGHKYSPEESGRMGIITTESGNRYIIAQNRNSDLYIVNTRASDEQRRAVALKRARDDPSARLPPLEFGKPWQVEDLKTTEVKELFLETGQFAPGDKPLPGYSQRDTPSPFKHYRTLLRQSWPGEYFD